jgi:hypothetical protein
LHIDPALPAGLHHLELIGCATTRVEIAGQPTDIADQPNDIAGLPVVHVDEAPSSRYDSPHASSTESRTGDESSPGFVLDVVGVDHVVVLADNVRTTCAEIERVSGAPLKRLKESDRGVQGFHRFGSVILEVVERRLVEPRTHSPVATYWGFVIVVADIEAVAKHLGPDVIGMPKGAVQEGRRIATVRSGAGLGVPLALMSPPTSA